MTLEDISKEELIDIINTYISNDYEAGEPVNVRKSAEIAGIDKEIAEILGLSYIFKDK